jgi:hypothetical protein
MNIDRIRVEDRHRADLGDLSDLSASIAALGLLQPIVVTTDGRLIAGQRRLEACRSLGWTEVDVHFITDREDAISLVEMERDENICRKDMTPTEKIRLGLKLEALARPEAKKRQGGHGAAPGRPANTSVPPNGSVQDRYDTREIVAPAVGLSTASYSRGKQLITAAEAGDETAKTQVAEMDRTQKITKPYQTWKGHNVNRGAAAKSKRNPFGTVVPPTSKRSNVKNFKGRKPPEAMENAIATLAGITMPMRTLCADDLREIPDEVRTRWTEELDQAITTLRQVRDLIKETS